MTSRWAVPLLLVLVGSGCSATRVVRLDTGDDVFFVAPREEEGAELEAAELNADEFQEALVRLARDVRPFRTPMLEARALFGVPSRSGVYRDESRGRRLRPEGPEDADGPRLLESYADEAVTRAYGQWCQRKSQPGDCLRLLDEGPLLASDGKYTLAMAIAMDSIWEETAEALEDMVDPDALRATLTASVTMYLLLWSLPEPVSKGVTATLAALAIAYLGVDTVWRLIDGWLTLVREVDGATSFEQLSEAGEAYGEVLGENAARVFVMLATAAIGNTAGLAAKSAGLPGSAQAALAVESQSGFPVRGGGQRAVGGDDGRGLHRCARAQCAGHGGPGGEQRRLEGEPVSSPRHGQEQRLHCTRRALDAAVQGHLQEGWDGAEGPREHRGCSRPQGTAPARVPSGGL